MSTSIHLIDGLARRAAHLYTLPNVAVRVLELTEQPQVDAIALRECIEKDPALTTKVLRVVNSSLFGLRRPVSNLSQALALLGTNPLKLLVLGFSLPTGLFSGIAASTLRWYWRRTLTKAVAARRLCEILGLGFADEAFVAALLQDLGMLLLIQELGAPYADLVDKARQHRCDLLALEVASLGFDHTTLTALLMADWGLPRAIIDSVAWEPGANLEAGSSAGRSDVDRGAPLPGSQKGHDCVGGVVHLAEWIARVLADGRADALDRLLDMGQRDHGLKPEQISALIASLQEEVAGLAEVLSLELSEGFDYRELLAAAHARLAEAAAEAAGTMLRAAASPQLAGEVRLVNEAAARWTCRSTRPAPAEASIESAAPPPSDGVALARAAAGGRGGKFGRADLAEAVSKAGRGGRRPGFRSRPPRPPRPEPFHRGRSRIAWPLDGRHVGLPSGPLPAQPAVGRAVALRRVGAESGAGRIPSLSVRA
jgi:HD-like signal output (HDOD) protein